MLRAVQWLLAIAILVIAGSWAWFLCALWGFGWAENGGPVAAVPGGFVIGLIALPLLCMLMLYARAYEKRPKS